MFRDSQKSRAELVRSSFWAIVFFAFATLASAQAPPAPAAPPAASSAPSPAPAPVPLRYMVVLDAAHGGNDSGGNLGDELEKTFTLALSVRLRSLLGARGLQVITTRESDTSVDINRRAEIANHANAQACLSLHATATGSGVHVFASSLAPAPPVRFPAWKTAQGAWVTRSLALAGVVNSSLLHAGFTVTLGRTALPEVDSMTCPALAIEIAPDRSPDHAAGSASTGLDDPGYQARVAEALAAAILEWKAEGRQP